MSAHYLRVAGQPKVLVVKTLRENPVTVLAEHRFSAALGVSHTTETKFAADLLFEGLIAPVTCDRCALTHIGLTAAGIALVAENTLPTVPKREFDNLLHRALDRIQEVASGGESFPFLIDEVTLPQWRSESSNERSFAHVVVRLKDDRDVGAGEHFSEAEQILFENARQQRLTLADHVSMTDWLRNHYAEMLNDSDPRICIVVEFVDGIA